MFGPKTREGLERCREVGLRKRPFLKGENNPAKRLEVRRKISLSKLGKKRNLNTKKKISATLKKREFKEEWKVSTREGLLKIREQISKRMKEKWKNKEYREKQTKSLLRKTRPTGFEKRLIELIRDFGLPYSYVGDGKLLINYKNPDFIHNNGKKILVEVYCSYHKSLNYKSPSNYERLRRETFKKYGFETLFLNEKDIYCPRWKKICLKKIIDFESRYPKVY